MKNTIDLTEKYISEHANDKKEYYPSTYHFMPKTGWVNDPNGVCYFRGEYHLFYQYNPYDVVWHAPYWGHAVTKDFITYKYLPAGLAPSETLKYGCFSGGAISANNKIYLCYTRHYDLENSHLEVQHLATSSDGILFTDTAEPILSQEHLREGDCKQDFRDPNPVEIDGVYYVCVGNKTNDNKGQMLVYSSKDLVSFEYHMTIRHEAFGSILECPDVFRLNNKDVVVFSSIGYEESNSPNGEKHGSYALIGNIDYKNKKYSFENIIRLDYGTDFYAPQSLDSPDGRRVMFGWLDLWNNSSHMRDIKNNTSGRYALPRELVLIDNNLHVKPVKEIYGFMHGDLKVKSGEAIQKNFYLKAKFTQGSKFKLFDDSGFVEIEKVDGAINLILNQTNHLKCSRSLPCANDCDVEIFSDHGSIEIFCSNGKVASAQVLLPSVQLCVSIEGAIEIIDAKIIN